MQLFMGMLPIALVVLGIVSVCLFLLFKFRPADRSYDWTKNLTFKADFYKEIFYKFRAK